MTFSLVWVCDKCGRELKTQEKSVVYTERKKNSTVCIPRQCIWCRCEAEAKK